MVPEMHATTTIAPLSMDVLAELSEFERYNRAYFAEWVADRGDDYFAHMSQRTQELIDEQLEGVAFPFVVRDGSARLIGRLNFTDVSGGSAALGYRIGQNATGVGHAGRAVQLAQAFAQSQGWHTIRAMTTHLNEASQRVLERAGFVKVEASPKTIDQNGVEYTLEHYKLDLR